MEERKLSSEKANAILNFARKHSAWVQHKTFKKSVRYIINTTEGLMAITKTKAGITLKPFFGMDLAVVQQQYGQIKLVTKGRQPQQGKLEL